jgi:hypothetical protein
MKLIYLHLMLRLNMGRTITPLSPTPPWIDVKPIKHRYDITPSTFIVDHRDRAV